MGIASWIISKLPRFRKVRVTDGPSKKPEDVFTPRSAEVNSTMYVARPDLEESLKSALTGSLHVLIHGESGCGKSWLYKQVLKAEDCIHIPINLANASNFDSIGNALKYAVSRNAIPVKTSYEESLGAELSAYSIAKAGIESTSKYEIPMKEPFEACLEHCRSIAGSRRAFLVLDNLEAIFSSPKLMQELGNVITLLDDTTYSKYNVRILIVGVPSRVREYFSKTINRQTIANRLKELPEVKALSRSQIQEFVTRGFAEQLKWSFEAGAFPSIVKRIEFVTLGVPQRLHEYCLELAHIAERNGNIVAIGQCEEADKNWLGSQLSNDFSCVQSIMNERETKVGRRNQALFALGQIEQTEFRNSDVERMIRSLFPKLTKGKTINVSQILSDLAGRSTPIIKKSSSKTDAYTFTDPRFKMCLRTMLRKDVKSEQVSHVDIKNL